MTELVDAILVGPDPYYGTDAVLYHPGQVVPDVPADWVSDQPFRNGSVDMMGNDGKLRPRAIQLPVRFRPISDAQKVAFHAKRERDLALVDEQRAGPVTGFLSAN